MTTYYVYRDTEVYVDRNVQYTVAFDAPRPDLAAAPNWIQVSPTVDPAAVAAVALFESTKVAVATQQAQVVASNANVRSGYGGGGTVTIPRGLPGGVAGLDDTGHVPIDELPGFVVNTTFPVHSQAEMLAVPAVPGDLAIRVDTSPAQWFILSASPAGTLANWSTITVASGAAVDSAVVHNTGAESIAGIKTFGAPPVVPDPTTNGQAANKGYVDTKATAAASAAASASVAGLAVDSGVVHNAGNETVAGVKAFTLSPTAPDPTTNTQLATKGYTDAAVSTTAAAAATAAVSGKANDSAVVHNTGAESVAGIKTFAASPVVPDPTINGQAANKGYADTKAAAASSTAATAALTSANTYTDSAVAAVTTAITGAGYAIDSGVVHRATDETVAGIKTFQAPPLVPDPSTNGQAANKGYVDAAITTAVGSRANDASVVHNTGNEAVGGIKAFTLSPTAPDPITSTQLATKGYVDTKAPTPYDDTKVVHNTGAESVAGIKTFTASPVVPTPTLSTHAVPAAYVDAIDQGLYLVTDPQWGLTSGSTDIAAAANAAIAAIPTASDGELLGALYIPAGQWTASAPIRLRPGLRIFGAGRVSTRLVFTAGGFYWPTSINSVTIEHLRIECSGGHMFYPTGDATHSGIYQTQIQFCYLRTNDATTSIMYHHTNSDYDGVMFAHCDVYLFGSSRTVPGWDIVNGGHAANSNIWRNLRIDGQYAANANAVAIKVENTDINGYAYDNVIESIIGERNPAGMVLALSWRGGRIAHVVDWDNTVPYVNHHIRLGKSASGTGNTSRNVEIRGCGRRGASGGVGATHDVELAANEVQYVDVFHPHNNGVSGTVGFSVSDIVNVWSAGSTTAYTGQPVGVYNSLHSLEVRTALVMNGQRTTAGTGSPERVLSANPGDVWHRTDGDPTSSFYIKGSGTGNVGWMAVPGPLWNVKDWGVRADGAGGWDDTTALNAMFAQALPGTTIYFPAPVSGSYYKITGPLTPPSGVTILGAGPGCEIRQATAYKPIFDLFNVNNVVVRGLSLYNVSLCGSTGGSSFRGDNLYAYSAGVWTNGSGNLIADCKISRFAMGIYFAAAASDGSSNADGAVRTRNVVRNVEVYQPNHGVLCLSQVGLRISDLYVHDHFDSSAGVNPNHAVYITGDSTHYSQDVVVTGCTATNNPTGSAYQLKYVNGAVLSDSVADTCYGLVNVIDSNDVALADLVSRNDQTPLGVNRSIMIQKVANQSTRVTMANIAVQMGTDGLPMILIADQVQATNLLFTTNHSGAFSGNNYEVSLRGSSMVVADMRINNVGSVQYKAVQVGFTSAYPTADVTLRDFEFTNTYDLVTWDSTATGRLLAVYNPGAQRSIGTAGTYFSDSTGTATWGMSRTEWTNTYAITAGATATPLPALETITRFAVGDATAFTVAGPVIKGKTGMTHDVVIANTTGSALGAVTWTTGAGGYSLTTPFVTPPAGASYLMRFMFDGTLWREIARSHGAGLAVPVVEVTGITGALSDGRFVGFTTSGPPTTGTFLVGDVVVSKADGSVYVCTAAGSPGTWLSPTSGSLPAAYTAMVSDRITTGEMTPQRDRIQSTVNMSTGFVYWTCFTAEKTEAINTLEMGGIGAAAGTTLARVGAYSVDGTGACTALLASSVNDTTAFNAAGKTQPFSLSSTWNKVSGSRYALAILVVATTMPTVMGLSLPSNGWITTRVNLLTPIMGGRFGAQADLPANMAAPVTTGSVPVGYYQYPAFYMH